jgi:cytochrome b561
MQATSKDRYDLVSQSLHWGVTVLIIAQFALGWSADDLAAGNRKTGLVAWHASLGMSLLVLATLWAAWRWRHPSPMLPSKMRSWERRLAFLTHATVYCLLFVLPLTGWLTMSARRAPMRWFGLFAWPPLMPGNQRSADILADLHSLLSGVLCTLLILHVAAALKHHFRDRDDVLAGMLPFTSLRRRESKWRRQPTMLAVSSSDPSLSDPELGPTYPRKRSHHNGKHEGVNEVHVQYQHLSEEGADGNAREE